MATKRLKRPRDPVSLAKLIGDIATGQTEDAVRPAGRAKGGIKGGAARAVTLNPERRREIAAKAAAARWKKKTP